MRHRLSFLEPSPALVVAFAALIAACSGLAMAATSKNPVIRACASKKTGALRLASRCRKSERSIAWSQRGPEGASGATGPTGATGASGVTGGVGLRGPQGPGATTFTATVAEAPVPETVATINGVDIIGRCASSFVKLELARASPTSTIQFSGTGASNIGGVFEVHENGGLAIAMNPSEWGDFDVIARDPSVGPFARIDVHAEQGSPCTFWGMITPSS